jgi:hypothetical protein
VFYHRLALALGMTVPELLGRMDSRELSDWQAYFQLEPFGPPQEDLRAGYLASLFYNVNRKSSAPARSAADFFPSLKGSLKTPTVQELRAAAMGWALAAGAVVKAP